MWAGTPLARRLSIRRGRFLVKILGGSIISLVLSLAGKYPMIKYILLIHIPTPTLNFMKKYRES